MQTLVARRLSCVLVAWEEVVWRRRGRCLPAFHRQHGASSLCRPRSGGGDVQEDRGTTRGPTCSCADVIPALSLPRAILDSRPPVATDTYDRAHAAAEF